MAKREWQKLKLPLLERLLLQETDEDHPLTVPEIIGALGRKGVSAERKSIYDDMAALRELGLDIQSRKGRSPGWFVGERPFQLAELKLLVDAVQSCKFITRRKSDQLISKLEGLTSRSQARLLHRQVYVSGRVKTMNESIYYNIDKLHAAIGENRAVTFRYFEYSVEKKRVFRRAGERYAVSPRGLIWDNDNYYLAGYDHLHGELRHYRVDKMAELAVTERPCRGDGAEFDLGSYAQKHFGMFSGREGLVTLRCAQALVGVVLDRFGQDVILTPDGEDAFTVTVRAVVSPQFLGWVFGLGAGVAVLSPAWAAEALQKQLAAVSARYAGPLAGPQGPAAPPRREARPRGRRD